MAKILLVEDDNNLREIYEARLQAEGYEIVAARDGEEALTVAIKERPDLIISDVMMPKISGFDMLDIIRSTEETKDAKVIMMTALSQAEDKARAEKLGADRYLVKSQVTLEDVAKVAREVLSGESRPSIPAPEPTATTQTQPVAPVTTPQQTIPATPQPVVDATANNTATPGQQTDDTSSVSVTGDPSVAPIPDPSSTPTVVPEPQAIEDEQSAIAAQIESFIDAKRAAPPKQPDIANPPAEALNPSVSSPQQPAPSTPEQPATGKKVIQPISDLNSSSSPDIDQLLEKEQEKEKMAAIAQELSQQATMTNNLPTTQESSPTIPVSDNPQLSVHPAPNTNTLVAPSPGSSSAPSSESYPDETNIPTPNIPHTNGMSIDGVVGPQIEQPQMQEQPGEQSTEQPPKPPLDPNSIAL